MNEKPQFFIHVGPHVHRKSKILYTLAGIGKANQRFLNLFWLVGGLRGDGMSGFGTNVPEIG
jgi:hypothetical protein